MGACRTQGTGVLEGGQPGKPQERALSMDTTFLGDPQRCYDSRKPTRWGGGEGRRWRMPRKGREELTDIGDSRESPGEAEGPITAGGTPKPEKSGGGGRQHDTPRRRGCHEKVQDSVEGRY